jgi:hypothetical protein
MVQLGLAELELDRGLLAEAEVHIKDLRNMNWEYEDLLRIDDTPITGVDRDRQERLQHAAARLRLKLVVGAVAGAAMIPAAEPTRTAMSPDENGSRPPR